MTNLIDDREILHFIAEVDRLTPPGTVDATIAEQRALYDAMSAHFRAPRPEGLPVRDLTLNGVPCRQYGQADGPHVMFLHGGGFVVGGLESHDDVAAEIASRTNTCVTAVDYRLAPEHAHPAAFEDALAVATAITPPLLIVGDSAGGTLAASVAWAERDTGRIAGQVLIYPALGGLSLDLDSYRDCAEAPLLTTADIRVYEALRDQDARADPTRHVLAAQDLNGVAPAFVSAAAVDPLRDDGVEYARRLTAEGIAARCVVEPQLPHMWLRARHQSARASAAFMRIIEAIDEMSAGISAG